MHITIYESATAWADKKFLACAEFAPRVHMNFFGATADMARQKAESWYAAEIERQRVLVGSSIEVASEPESRTSVKPAARDYGSDGRGHHFVGKVWMLNRATGHKARIAPEEVSQYLNNGYVKAGPRSK